MNILITGFEPFGSRPINMSWEVAKTFMDSNEINVIQLPVSYSRAHKIVLEHLSNTDYDLIIMLGETSSQPNVIRLERVAINLKDSISFDNDGEIADEEVLCKDSPIAYFTNFPIKKISQKLNDEGFKVKMSNSAGTFVCNCLYFNVLRYIFKRNLKTYGIFLHLPSSNDYLSLEVMTQTIRFIICNYNQLP